MIKTAILYIALGRYIIFWSDFYSACEKYFLPFSAKTYYVFTDSEHIAHEDKPNVIRIKHNNLKWPYSTLMRFEMFLAQKNSLFAQDYVFYLNANALPCAVIGKEILPSQEQGIMVTSHPMSYKIPKCEFTFERNPESTACVKDNDLYICGGFFGGRSHDFIELCETLDANIKKDLDNNIIAIWHDESHLNRYILDKKPLVLSHQYAYPENYYLVHNLKHDIENRKNKKILLLDKDNEKYGGIEWLRGETDKKAKYVRTVHINGGLGNQMFQYAFAKSLEHKHQRTVLLDVSYFFSQRNHLDDSTIRPYELQKFHITLDVANAAQTLQSFHSALFSKENINKIYNDLVFHYFKIFVNKLKIMKRRTFFIEESAYEYDEDFLVYRTNAHYRGYFQTEKYFKNIRKLLLEDFTLKLPLNNANMDMLAQIKQCNSVSIHFRRGDYISQKANELMYNVCSMDYYNNAVSYIKKHVQAPHFYIFSDEPEWVKENFKIPNNKITVVDINPPADCVFDLELMKHCKHHIIANSSFSWWGAWLNTNPNKIVVAPKQWLNSKIISTKDIIAEGWVAL